VWSEGLGGHCPISRKEMQMIAIEHIYINGVLKNRWSRKASAVPFESVCTTVLQFLEQHRRELWGCAWFVLGYAADGLCVVLAQKLNVRAVSSHSLSRFRETWYLIFSSSSCSPLN
jgi:hypothetical protein